MDPKTVKVEINCEDKTINVDMRTVPEQPKHVFMGMTFAKLRPGSFWMGTDKDGREYLYERPRHKESIPEPIFMQTTEVTEKNWKDVMGDNPADSGEPNQPIVEISWDMARQFAEKLSALDPDGTYRLPMEKEWGIRLPGQFRPGILLRILNPRAQKVRLVCGQHRKPLPRKGGHQTGQPLGVCLTCTATYGSGCRISSIFTRARPTGPSTTAPTGRICG